MDFVETNKVGENKKSKKPFIALIVVTILLCIVAVVLYIMINYLKSTEFKFIVDNQKTKIPTGLFVYENDEVYVSIKDLAPIINYKYFNGGYKKYSEDNEECYIEGEDEIVTFENKSKNIYKTPSDKIDYQLFTIDEPIKQIEDKLYVSLEGAKIAFNIEIYSELEENRITVYTLPYLANYYSTGKYTYSAIASDFNNQKAIRYNLLVVQNVENTDTNSNKNIRYGITTLSGEEIVGTKYTKIEFIENTQEFIVTTEEKKVGIITSNGETKVIPQYDELKLIEKDLNLYLAKNNNKYGIIEKNGKILIYLEYDQIGIDTKDFESNNIRNPYVLFDNAIPVKQYNKWGMYDIKGNLILPLEYDEIGCVLNNKAYNNTVVIPSIQGIVFAKEYELERNSKTKLYGIYNQRGIEMVPTALETIYFIINNGREEYTMKAYQGEEYDVIDYYDKYIRNTILL